MAVDYDAIRDRNTIRHGTNIGNTGALLLSNRYANRTHFIFALLQHAEDALARGRTRPRSRRVRFDLDARVLRVSHFGIPFDEHDVEGIRDIGQTGKDRAGLTTIGRFGIGFKSVFEFTQRPEIHSGPYVFAMENYVHPFAAPKIDRKGDETVIRIPLRGDVARDSIVKGLAGLQSTALSFFVKLKRFHATGTEWKRHFTNGRLGGMTPISEW